MNVKKPDPGHLVPYETRDEIRLILACSKGPITRDTRETIAILLKKELNWDYVFRQAERHELIPLLYYNLKITAPELVPEDILGRMDELYLINLKRSMIQASDLLKTILLCRNHEIPVIAYKGVALSQQIYGDIGLRKSSDIDIIVRQQDVTHVKDLLVSRGYTPQISLTPEQEKRFIQERCEYNLSHPHKTMIEVHWQFFPGNYLSPFKETDIWSGLKAISLEGTEIFTLSPEMLIIALCIHGAKHQWRELKQIGDIAGIIESEKDINWERLVKIAREKRIERITFLGLRLAEVFMKTRLPGFVSDAISRDPAIQSLVSSRIEYMFIKDQIPEGKIQMVFYWLSVREKIRDKLQVIILLTFKPDHDDWAFISLPRALSPLYYIIRPIRLLFKYGVPR